MKNPKAQRLSTRGIVAIALLALASCGNAQFEKSFDEGFTKGAKESCVRSARQAGAPDAKAETYCSCFVDHMRSWTTQEKMAIDPKSEKFKAVAAACQPG